MTSTPPSPPRPANPPVSTTSSSFNPSAQAPAAKPAAPPVSILPSPIAQIYSLAHPAVLLVVLVARFRALVADPVAELLNDLPFLALLQVGYVMVCLPPAGSVVSSPPSSSSSSAGASAGASEASSDGDEKRRPSSGSGAGTGTVVRPGRVGYRRKHHAKGDSAGLAAKLVPALIALTLTTLLATPVLAILLVLFGAPLTTHNFETILCAAHMAVLSATALVYVHGVDTSTWREVWGMARPADAVWGGALGTGVGAWFGAVPIPLDWDRPWQAYPITILTGAYIGFAIGSLISRTTCLYGKRIQFMPEEPSEEKKTE